MARCDHGFVGTHSKRYRPIAHPRDAAKLVLILAAISIPGLVVTMTAHELIEPTGMSQTAKSAILQAVPLIWVIGSLYLIKTVLARRASSKEPVLPQPFSD